MSVGFVEEIVWWGNDRIGRARPVGPVLCDESLASFCIRMVNERTLYVDSRERASPSIPLTSIPNLNNMIPKIPLEKKLRTSVKAKLNVRKDTPSDYYTVILQVVRQRRRSVIFTPYRLRSEEFDSERGTAIPQHRTREHRAYIEEVNTYLHQQMLILRNLITVMEQEGKPFSAQDVVSRFRLRDDHRYVAGYFRSRIEELHREGKHGSAQSLEYTLRAFLKFAGHRYILMEDLDAPLLQSFRNHLLREGLCPNTITFYLSKLRAVYNRSVLEGYVLRHADPFVSLPLRIAKTPKLALSDDVLRRVALAELCGRQAVARDLFMFSFYCRGMSFVDMAYLRQTDISDGVIHYRRRKTGQLFTVRVLPQTQEIIDRYRSASTPYVLPILESAGPSPIPAQRERELYELYCRRRSDYIHLLRGVSRTLGLDVRLSFNTARHTWASRARRKNISVSVISEGLGHTTEKTTRIYLEEMESSRIDAANIVVTTL